MAESSIVIPSRIQRRRTDAVRHAVSLYREAVGGGLAVHRVCLERYVKAHGRTGMFGEDMIRSYLRSHNLACWCALDQPCHADALLEIAND